MEKENNFTSIKFELNHLTHEQIHEKLGKGICNLKEYSYCVNKFGFNLINFETKSIIQIFIGQLIRPLYIYQIYSVQDWYRINYNSFATITLILIIVILTIDSWHKYKCYEKIQNFTLRLRARIKRHFVLLL